MTVKNTPETREMIAMQLVDYHRKRFTVRTQWKRVRISEYGVETVFSGTLNEGEWKRLDHMRNGFYNYETCHAISLMFGGGDVCEENMHIVEALVKEISARLEERGVLRLRGEMDKETGTSSLFWEGDGIHINASKPSVLFRQLSLRQNLHFSGCIAEYGEGGYKLRYCRNGMSMNLKLDPSTFLTPRPVDGSVWTLRLSDRNNLKMVHSVLTVRLEGGMKTYLALYRLQGDQKLTVGPVEFTIMGGILNFRYSEGGSWLDGMVDLPDFD